MSGIVLANYHSRDSNKEEEQAAYWLIGKKMPDKHKEHNGRGLIDQETIVVRTSPVRCNAPNRHAFLQPHYQLTAPQA